jgi:hypothetical protein
MRPIHDDVVVQPIHDVLPCDLYDAPTTHSLLAVVLIVLTCHNHSDASMEKPKFRSIVLVRWFAFPVLYFLRFLVGARFLTMRTSTPLYVSGVYLSPLSATAPSNIRGFQIQTSVHAKAMSPFEAVSRLLAIFGTVGSGTFVRFAADPVSKKEETYGAE